MKGVAYLLALDSALALGFIIPSLISINDMDSLIIISLSMILIPIGIVFQVMGTPRPQKPKKGITERQTNRPLVGRIGNGIVLLSVLGFFLGMGIISGISQDSKSYIPIISWFFPSVFLTGIQLFLLTMMLFLGLTLWALVHNLRKRRNN